MISSISKMKYTIPEIQSLQFMFLKVFLFFKLNFLSLFRFQILYSIRLNFSCCWNYTIWGEADPSVGQFFCSSAVQSHFNVNCKLILIVHIFWLVNSCCTFSRANAVLAAPLLGSGGNIQNLSEFERSCEQFLRFRVCLCRCSLLSNLPRVTSVYTRSLCLHN